MFNKQEGKEQAQVILDLLKIRYGEEEINNWTRGLWLRNTIPLICNDFVNAKPSSLLAFVCENESDAMMAVTSDDMVDLVIDVMIGMWNER